MMLLLRWRKESKSCLISLVKVGISPVFKIALSSGRGLMVLCSEVDDALVCARRFSILDIVSIGMFECLFKRNMCLHDLELVTSMWPFFILVVVILGGMTNKK